MFLTCFLTFGGRADLNTLTLILALRKCNMFLMFLTFRDRDAGTGALGEPRRP